MKTKEDKIIEKSEVYLNLLKNKYKDDEFIAGEYSKLLDEYKKLLKRFDKTLKMNDSNDLHILKNTEILKDNVDYTIKKAKEKLFSNVVENRKIKELHTEKINEAVQIIKQLKIELRQAHLKIITLEQ